MIVIAVLIPQVLVSRITANYLSTFAVTYQKTKSEMSNIGTEALSNIRTVKAFADEEMCSLKF